MARVRHSTRDQRRHVAAVRRDTALSRLSSITAAIAVGTVAAVGAIGVYVAKASPRHHAATSTATNAPGTAVSPGTTGNSGAV